MNRAENLIEISIEIDSINHDLYQLNEDSKIYFNVNEVSEDAKTSNTSFSYSGRHDHGFLDNLKCEDGVAKEYDKVIAGLLDSKKIVDAFIVDKMKK